jgi:hypothetical protein
MKAMTTSMLSSEWTPVRSWLPTPAARCVREERVTRSGTSGSGMLSATCRVACADRAEHPAGAIGASRATPELSILASICWMSFRASAMLEATRSSSTMAAMAR